MTNDLDNVGDKGPGDVALPDGAMPWDVPENDTLGEIRPEEIPTPRLRIMGKEGEFENIDTSERYKELNVIILGLVRQRVMWGKDVGEGEVPMCRSLDAVNGFPNVDDDVVVKKQFPWGRSNFKREELPIVDGQPIAPCKDCVFKEWNNEDDEPSPCAEQLVLPVYYADRSSNWAPGILTFQRSSFSNTMRYLGAMKSTGLSPFQVHTRITLDMRQNGDVVYSVAKFHKEGPTEAGEPNEQGYPSLWNEYFMTFHEVKEFLRRPRRRSKDADNENYAPSEPTGTPDNRNDGYVDAEVVPDEPVDLDTPPEPQPEDDDAMVF